MSLNSLAIALFMNAENLAVTSALVTKHMDTAASTTAMSQVATTSR